MRTMSFRRNRMYPTRIDVWHKNHYGNGKGVCVGLIYGSEDNPAFKHRFQFAIYPYCFNANELQEIVDKIRRLDKKGEREQ